jgi:hypothetical protein
MPLVEQAIHENDVVELIYAVKKTQAAGQWPAGTIGAVVSEHDQHKLIEIADDRGVMLDLISQTEDRLKLITKYS